MTHDLVLIGEINIILRKEINLMITEEINSVEKRVSMACGGLV